MMDAVRPCRWCAFYVIDYAPTIETGPSADGWTITAFRSSWELEMFRHCRDEHPAEFAELGATEAGLIAELRDTMDRMVKWAAGGLTKPS